MKTKKGKKNVSSLVCTGMIIGTLSFTILPESHSVYLKDEDKAFKYNVNLYSMFTGNADEHNPTSYVLVGGGATDYKKITLNLTFPRNTNIINDVEVVEDTYYIYKKDLPKSCSLRNVTEETINGEQGYRINVGTTETEIGLQVQCTNVQELIKNEHLILNFPVYESVNGEEEQVNCYNAFFYYSKDKYFDEFKIPEAVISADGKKLTIPHEILDKKREYENWMLKFTSEDSNPNKDEYTEYFDNVWRAEILNYMDEAFVAGKEFELKGIDVHCDANVCEYQILDNLLGYVKTKKQHNMEPYTSIFFSEFAHLTSDQIKNIIEEYLNMYFPDDFPKDVPEMINYISNKVNGDFTKLFEGSFSGTIVPNINNYEVMFHRQMLEVIRNEMLGTIRINHNVYNDDKQSVFFASITGVYSNLNLPTSVLISIRKNTELVNAAISTDKGEFNEYYLVLDKETNPNRYLVFNVYSVTEGAEKYNYVTLTEIPLQENTTIETFTISKDAVDSTKLNVQIVGKTKEEILDLVNKVNTYFEQTVIIDETTLVPDENGNITLNYLLDIPVKNSSASITDEEKQEITNNTLSNEESPLEDVLIDDDFVGPLPPKDLEITIGNKKEENTL